MPEQVRIEITVEVEDGFDPLDAAAEVLFNAGIGNPDKDGSEWLNNYGQAYRVLDWHSTSGGSPIEHHLARKV